MTNNNKWQTMPNDKQRTMTNYEWQMTNLDYSDQLKHSDNHDWSMINQKDDRRIRIVYLVLLCLRAPKRASYILSECVLEVFNSIGDYWRNRRLCHWKIGIRMKWGHRASGMEILLYSEIYGVGSTAGDFWHNFKIQSCYFITTENTWRTKNK